MSNQDEERPPVFKSWKIWYRLVLGIFIIQVIIFYLISAVFK
jgi:hypothetical protein